MLQFRKITKQPASDVKKLETKLWDIFSVYIRLRDSDRQGVGKCFTCGKVLHWAKGDCGHGIPRQHKATKFNEMNNHLQCKPCNGFQGGKREVYKERMNKIYGSQTWEKMEIASRQTVKWSAFILQNNIDYYSQKVRELKLAKGMI